MVRTLPYLVQIKKQGRGDQNWSVSVFSFVTNLIIYPSGTMSMESILTIISIPGPWREKTSLTMPRTTIISHQGAT